MSLESWLQRALGLLGSSARGEEGALGEEEGGAVVGPKERKALVAVVGAVEELLLACRLGEEEMLQDWGHSPRAGPAGLLDTLGVSRVSRSPLECAIFSLGAAEARRAASGPLAAGEDGGGGVGEKPDLALLALRASVRQLLQRLQERESAAAAGEPRGARAVGGTSGTPA